MQKGNLVQQLQKIVFSSFVFKLQPAEKLTPGRFYTSTIRGGFGYSFRKVCCLYKNINSCSECLLKNHCAYSLLFESKIQNTEARIKTEDIPRPYVIDIQIPAGKILPGENLFSVNIILIGKAIKYLPYFFLSFQQLGEQGLGQQRKHFIVQEVTQYYPVQKLVYSLSQNTLQQPDSGFLNLTAGDNFSNQITVRFLTPTRIKYNGKLLSLVEFHHLVRSLIHRITLLAEHWCDTRIEYNWKDLIKESECVKIKNCKIKWVELARYSSRQKTKMKMGGIVGEITYKGAITNFYPLLQLGSYLHTGKNTTFGLGKYEIALTGEQT